VIDMLVAEKQRRRTASGRVGQQIQAQVTWLERQLDDIDRELHDVLRGSPVWHAKDYLLRGVPGVGAALSATLLAELRNSAR
jgi:transposase